MSIGIRAYREQDLTAMREIWNEVVADGIAFPQTEPLTEREAEAFFAGLSFAGVAADDYSGQVFGLYALRPNNVGRCGHSANAAYAVRSTARGRKIGEKLVQHSMEKAGELGFRLLQFNAVVKTNDSAIHLYEKLGFVKLGVIPQGFLMKDGTFEDTVLFYRTL